LCRAAFGAPRHVELEMKIIKYRQHAILAATDELTGQRIAIAELEQKLREIDE